jgi:hypothetical protein
MDNKMWENSRVMTEFLKIASDSGLINSDLTPKDEVGNPSKPTPVKDHRRYEPTEEYDVKIDPSNIVEKAHPKGFQAAKAMGDGGIVENVVKKQEKNIEIATKMPRGALIGVHASILANLSKMSEELKNSGKIVEALCIENTVDTVDNKLHKEAAFFVPLLLLAKKIGLGVGAFYALKQFGVKLTSTKDGFVEDMKDLHDKLEENSSESKSASSAAQLLKPFIPKIESIDFSTNIGISQFSNLIRQLRPVMKKVGFLVASVKHDYKEPSEFFSTIWERAKGIVGFDAHRLISEKYSDALESYKDAAKHASNAKSIETKMTDIAEKKGALLGESLDNILSKRGFLGKLYSGDDALINLQKDVNLSLEKLYKDRKLNKLLTVNIEKEGKAIVSSMKLKRILEMVESLLGR